MVTVRIYRLDHPPGALADRLLEAQIEAAHVPYHQEVMGL